MVSLTERDGLAATGEQALWGFARRATEAGLTVEELRPVTAEDVEQLGSSWAKRLGIPRRRPAWLLHAKNGVIRRDPA
jgi:hypothetical protein